MKTKKILALLLSAAMVFTMAGCGAKDDAKTDAPVEDAADDGAEAPETPETPVATEASIDFEDGAFGFAGNNTSITGGLGESTLSVTDFGGSKALTAVPAGKNVCVGLQIDALLGDNLANLKTIEVSLGVASPDGSFYACSGQMYALLGEDLVKDQQAWSVYLETANPKVATYTVPEGQSFVAGSQFAISMETDNALTEGAGQSTLYIDNITFKDADGNVLAADKTAEFALASSVDRSNLCNLTNAVEFPDFAISGGGWGQDGFEMPEEIIAALVPGSVVEIEYASTTGNLWIVMPDAAAGWMRVGDGTNGVGYYNNSKSTVQITYEQLAQFCGDDVSTWGARMQCESDDAWEVFSVKVGQKAPVYVAANPVEFPDFAISGGGWGQDGFEMPQEIIDALVPGSVVEIDYESTTGKIWIIMPDAAAGWMRVGDGTNGTAVCDGSKCYITYEQIAEFCGDDKSTWGARMQCESDDAWEVFGVKVGTAAEMKMANGFVEFPDFAISGGGWGQDGFEMPQEIIDALVPGSVVNISYASTTGKLWIVMPDAAAGWMRVGDGTNGAAACKDGICQITYEQLAQFCGDDVSTWGARMQCESDDAWEVYGVSVGMAN